MPNRKKKIARIYVPETEGKRLEYSRYLMSGSRGVEAQKAAKGKKGIQRG